MFGRGMSPVATLVGRATRFLLLVALPDGHRVELVADALAARGRVLPAALARSLTWDQGHEMAEHARFTLATGMRATCRCWSKKATTYARVTSTAREPGIDWTGTPTQPRRCSITRTERTVQSAVS